MVNPILRATLLVLTLAHGVPFTSAQSTPPESSTSTTAKPWPREFRQVAFGASMNEAEKVLGRMKCSEIPDFPQATSCWTTDKAKAFRVDGQVVPTRYIFLDDRFVKVEMSEPDRSIFATGPDFHSPVGPLLFAFKEKFGPADKGTKGHGDGRNFQQSWSNETMRAQIRVAMRKRLEGTDEQYLESASIWLKEFDDKHAEAMAKKVAF